MSTWSLILSRSASRQRKRQAFASLPSIMVGIAVSGWVSAQESEGTDVGRQAWKVVPSVFVRETYTDNAAVSSSDKKSDWITELGPGIRIDGRTARLRIHADYRLSNLIYASGSRGDRVQHSLNSSGTLEALDDLLFVDVIGNISRQQISAFGNQSAANYSVNGNSTENRTFRVSPYVKGQVAGYASYELRYSDTRSRSDSANATEINSSIWSGRLSGATPFAALGWTIDADDQRNEYISRRTNDSEHWRGTLIYTVSPQFKLSGSTGKEQNNYLSSQSTAYSTHGYGFEWRPTARTQVSASKEKRFFGNGHAFLASHRFARSAVKYTDTRDVSVIPPRTLAVGLGTYYDLFDAFLSAQFPDETERARMVDALLALYGLSPNAVVVTDFINAQATVRRRQELSYVVQGARNVVTFSLVRSFDERLGTAILVGIDDFSTTSTIRQQGINVSWAHQLSALSALNVNAGYSRNRSAGDLDLKTNHKTLSATLTMRLGAKTHGSITARRTENDRSSASYTENSLVGAVTVEF